MGTARKKEAGRVAITEPLPVEIDSYNMLQRLFTRPENLTHFDPAKRLFVDCDSSLETGHGAYAYHVKDEQQITASRPPGPKSQLPILFLSRGLTDAERRYWSAELEMAGLVWTVKRLRYYIEASHHTTIVYTDHSALVDVLKQSSLNTTSLVRLNIRHIRSSEYLSRFRLDVRYRTGRSNVIPDALSRLPTTVSVPATTSSARATPMLSAAQEVQSYLKQRQKRLCDGPDLDVEHAYLITVAHMSDDFKQ